MGAKDSTVLDGERKMSSPVRIFYSYAHEDERLRGELEKHLSSLRRQGLIVEWHDRNISAGTEWKHEIDKYLNIADIILLLISPDFIASDYCYGIEMTRAMERHKCGEARVIPILLRPIDLDETPIEQLQSLPEDRIPISLCNNQDAAFRDVARGLRTAIKEIGNSASSSHHPSFVQRTIQTTPPTYESKNRQRLLSRVRAFWITGVLEHSLHNAALITLGLHEQPDAVENPWRLAVQELNLPSHPLPPGIRITQVYDDADGELLILGEPGSGKTTLLLELARDLLDRAERDGSYPMPVVFNLSSWAVKQQPIIDWLIEELNTKYQVQRELSQSWVQTDQILPLLDGLDEVTPRCRAACVEAINAYRREHSIVSTVVCSRSAEYLALMNRALLRTAVVVQPLTKQQIDDYLSKADGKLASVQTALRTNPVLEKFVTTPLILSVLALAYHGKPLEDLPMIGSSTAQLRQVFATYIERVLQHRRAKSNYTPRQMVCWLKWLAQQMRQHNLTIFYIEHMQPDWLSDGRSSRSYPRIVAGAVIGLFLGLISGLLIGINWGQIIGSFQGLLVGSFQGLLVGLVGGSLFGAIGGLLFGAFGAPLELVSSWMIEIKPAEIVDWSWVNMQRNILKALYYGCILGLISGVMSSFYDNPLRSSGGLFGGFFNQLLNELFYGRHSALFDKVPSGIFDGAAIGSITAFVIVLVSGISSKKLDNYARSIPNQGI